MRFLNFVLCILMLLFAGVQYNDPDGAVWLGVYLVPAIWSGLAAHKWQVLRRPLVKNVLRISLVSYWFATIYYWQSVHKWWGSALWYESEKSREGLGLLIVSTTPLVAWAHGRIQTNIHQRKFDSKDLPEYQK